MIRNVLLAPLRILFGIFSAILAPLAGTPPQRDGRAGGESWLWRTAKAWARRAVVVLAVLGAGGALLMVSGLVPIKASSGHWAITAWVLNFAKSRSVATHTLGLTAPPLEDRRLAMMGAGQFDVACAPCHGSPGMDQPRVAGRMTPRPPDLREAVRKFDPEELFYIVQHGIKFTGMPAWPARRRDDEVWAMVAFLRRLPGIDPRQYAELVNGPAEDSRRAPIEDLVAPTEAPSAVRQSCARCHGLDGLGRGVFPVLAGQRAEYLRASLEAYAKGERHSGFMEPVAAPLGPDEMQAIAAYYARRPRASGAAPRPEGGDVERGRRIAEEGLPDTLVPGCNSCHGPGLTRNPRYPELAGQHAHYLRQQLALFKSRTRGGTAYQHIMQRVAGQLSEADMRDAAAYFASLRGGGQ
jgi:cytochrome c553